jgi:hypothetical protein
MRATFVVCGTVFAQFMPCVALAEPTRTVDDSPADGAMDPADRPDSLRFALGLAGSFALLAQDSVGTAGAILDLHYEMSRLEAGFDLRGGGASSGGFFACSIGARRFISQGDVNPYFGGGLAWSVFSFNPAYGSNASGSGLGAYAGAGVETLRTHHGHLAVGLRLDVPFFALTESGMVAGDNAGRGTIFRGPPTTYYAPLTLETRLTF